MYVVLSISVCKRTWLEFFHFHCSNTHSLLLKWSSLFLDMSFCVFYILILISKLNKDLEVCVCHEILMK